MIDTRLLIKNTDENYRQGIRSLPSISLSIIYCTCGLFVVYRYFHFGIYVVSKYFQFDFLHHISISI